MTITFTDYSKTPRNLRPWHPCDTENCVARQGGGRESGRREGVVHVEILGRHAAFLCGSCAKNWNKSWRDADAPYRVWLDSPGEEYMETLFPVDELVAA